MRTLVKDGRCLCCESPGNVELYEEGARLCSGSVLVMGLGLGIVAKALARNPKVSDIVVVEIDPNVATIVGKLPNVDVILADARKFIPSKNFDICYWDIHSEWDGQTVLDYYELCKKSLKYAVCAFGLIDTWLDRGYEIG